MGSRPCIAAEMTFVQFLGAIQGWKALSQAPGTAPGSQKAAIMCAALSSSKDPSDT